MTSWDGESKEGVHEVWHGGVCKWSECGVAELVTRNTLRWFGLTGRMEIKGFVKKVYLGDTEGPNGRGRRL